jgi:integrase
MPLDVVRRPGRDGWWITGTVTPAGARQGVRIRRRAGSDDFRLAREEAIALEAQILRNAHLGERPAVKGWGEAVASYLRHEQRSVATTALLTRLTRHFRDTPLDRIDQAAIDTARDVVLRPGAAPATVLRNLVVPVRAVLEHAAWKGWGPSPRLAAPTVPPATPDILMPGQVEAMIAASKPGFAALWTWLACTGARVGETLLLEWPQVDLRAGVAVLLPETTKARKRRVVQLPPAAVAALAGLAGRDGRVFRRVDGEPYRESDFGGGQLRSPWATACQAAGVPGRWQEWTVAGKPRRRWVPELGPHAMRHSWASWHYALHRDLLRLRDEGGWATVAQVERYAHLMPSGHEAAIRRVWGSLAPQRHRAARSA